MARRRVAPAGWVDQVGYASGTNMGAAFVTSPPHCSIPCGWPSNTRCYGSVCTAVGDPHHPEFCCLLGRQRSLHGPQENRYADATGIAHRRCRQTSLGRWVHWVGPGAGASSFRARFACWQVGAGPVCHSHSSSRWDGRRRCGRNEQRATPRHGNSCFCFSQVPLCVKNVYGTELRLPSYGLGCLGVRTQIIGREYHTAPCASAPVFLLQRRGGHTVPLACRHLQEGRRGAQDSLLHLRTCAERAAFLAVSPANAWNIAFHFCDKH